MAEMDVALSIASLVESVQSSIDSERMEDLHQLIKGGRLKKINESLYIFEDARIKNLLNIKIDKGVVTVGLNSRFVPILGGNNRAGQPSDEMPPLKNNADERSVR